MIYSVVYGRGVSEAEAVLWAQAAVGAQHQYFSPFCSLEELSSSPKNWELETKTESSAARWANAMAYLGMRRTNGIPYDTMIDIR